MGNYLGVILCCLAGGVFLFFAGKRFIETIIFLRASQKTVGKVVSYDILTTHSNTHLPVVEFKTPGETIVRITSKTSSDPPAYKIGDMAKVRYLRKNPQTARINSFYEMWLLTLLFAVFGIISFIVALSIYPTN